MKNLLLLLTLLFLLTRVHAETDSFSPSDPRTRPAAAAVSSSDPGVRLSITPLLGMVGGWPGAGIDFGMGVGHLALGIRHAGGTELCFMCDHESQSESQTSLLVGLRQEFEAGVISLRSGIANVDRNTLDARIEGEYGPGVRNYNGFAVPLQLDLILGGRYLGFCLSATFLADGDGGSGGFMIGLPFGMLRQ